MRAATWTGVNEVSVETVPDPQILNDHDVILRVRRTTTCGSDLHLLGGYIPFMRAGDVLGHEFMGEVVEVGPECRTLRVGDRVVVPAPPAGSGRRALNGQGVSIAASSASEERSDRGSEGAS